MNNTCNADLPNSRATIPLPSGVGASLARWAALLVLCAGLLPFAARSSTWVWTGGGGANGNWNNSANWGSAGIPANGDSVVFQGAAGLLNTNNIAGLTLNQVRFIGGTGGFDIRGNAFTVTNNIEATNTAGVANIIENNITFASVDQIVDVSVSLTLSGVLSGGVGMIKNGAGTLLINGPLSNTYGGTTTVNAGLVQLAKNGSPAATAIPGNLVIGDGSSSATVQNIFGLEIADSANMTINNNGLWDLNGWSETIGSSLTLNGNATISVGAVSMGLTAPSTITVNGGACNITGTGSVQLGAGPCGINVATGVLNIYPSVQGAAAITKTGVGNLNLYGANTYSGLTSVNAGWLWAENNLALGATTSGTVVASGAILVLDGGVSITNEPLTLNGPGQPGWGSLDVETGIHTWAGPITNNANSTLDAWSSGSELHINGVISGAGGLELFNAGAGGGTHFFEGTTANTYGGLTTVDGGCTLVLNKSSGVTAIPGNLDILGTARYGNNNQIVDSADVFVEGGGTYDFATFFDDINTMHGTGSVTFGLDGYVDIGAAGGTSTFDGLMSGTGFLGGYTVGKFGSGTFTMTANNTFQNGLYPIGGTLIVNGNEPQNPVIVVGVGATLAGSGTVGDITSLYGNNGTISPGTSPGILTCSNVILTATASFKAELAGPTPGAGGYDQLNVRGTINLASASLIVVPAFTTAVALGQQFTILNNDLADAVTGTFSGLAEGATIAVGGYKFTISYHGGSGNDVALTLTALPAAQAGSSVSLGDGNGVIDPNECDYLNIVITNSTGTPMTGISATLVSTTPNVAVTQPLSTYADVPANSRGTNVAPFQITTAPGFVCGSTVNLLLTVVSASHGSFTIPVVLSSGSISAVPLRYDNSVSTGIPDIGTIESTNVASGFTGPLEKVVVSLYITHSYDSDLTNVSLISPDGTTVLLSSANGGSGANYGSALSPDADRTTFDDAGGTAITAGTAPFVGTFRPQSPLSAFIGNPTPNGNWRLHIADGYGGSLGTLRGWSLFLYPIACTAGSGVCELCPNVTITSATGPDTPTQPNYLTFPSPASVCGVPKSCPGTTVSGLYPSDNYTFQNGLSDACITVTVTNTTLAGAQMLATVYADSYNPANPDKCVNYLADGGNVILPGGGETFSFNVASNATFVVNLIAATGALTTPYSLTVTGGDCRPVLNIIPADAHNVKLDWTTAAAGYNLEGTNSLSGSGTNWPPVTNVPVIINSRFMVTNGAASGDEFYRLHKP